MSTAAILPVKSFTAAKQRLSDSLSERARETLAEAMVSDVLETLGAAPDVDEVIVVTADARARRVAAGRGVTIVHDAREAGQSPAARRGIAHAMQRGHAQALLVPGDTPLLDGAELGGMIERARTAGTAVAIVPDRHGEGTNALMLTPPLAIEPSFGPGSLARHLDAARTANATHEVEELPGLMLDVDTPEDLRALVAELQRRSGQAPNTRAALARLGILGDVQPERVRS